MTVKKPPCPVCGDNAAVKTKGGGTLGQYRYICKYETCMTEWQETPPHKLDDNQRPNIKLKKKPKICQTCALEIKKCECKNIAQNAEMLMTLQPLQPVPTHTD